MDRRLTGEDLEWLKLMRSEDSKPPAPPEPIGQKLTVLGLASPCPDGGLRITFRGRDELIDRERVDMRWRQ